MGAKQVYLPENWRRPSEVGTGETCWGSRFRGQVWDLVGSHGLSLLLSLITEETEVKRETGQA